MKLNGCAQHLDSQLSFSEICLTQRAANVKVTTAKAKSCATKRHEIGFEFLPKQPQGISLRPLARFTDIANAKSKNRELAAMPAIKENRLEKSRKPITISEDAKIHEILGTIRTGSIS